VTIEVENRNWNRATVYSIRGVTRVRLGDVETNQRKIYTIDGPVVTAVGTIQIYVRFFASRATYTFPALGVQPGDRVFVVIENYLPLSWILRRE